jgi:tRNA pseudouridine38-40 synthase
MDRTVWARLEFDGTGFVGWQLQPGARTVQGEVEAVLARLCGRPVRVHAAGRTDAGVHALGMAISATVPERWTPETLHRALNALLPPDCWVAAVREVRPGFHARRCALARVYRYRVGTDPAAASPFRRRWEWALGQPLPMDTLRQCAAVLAGRHDFRAFAAHAGGRRNCRCEIRRAEWIARRGNRGADFVVAADRFLHRMVRVLVGTMVEAALGRRPVEDLERLLASTPGMRASPPAPPQGLCFLRAEYPAYWFRLGD